MKMMVLAGGRAGASCSTDWNWNVYRLCTYMTRIDCCSSWLVQDWLGMCNWLAASVLAPPSPCYRVQPCSLAWRWAATC